MNMFSVARPGLTTGQSQVKRVRGLLIGALMLVFGGSAGAATTVGLVIENDTDNNGIISVVDGTKVVVTWDVIANDEKLLNKKDKIELLRASDDELVSSATRGKGSSGKVSLKVKNSEGEELYVRYRAKKDGSFPNATPDIMDPDRVPLMSIAAANISELTVRMNALETAPPMTYAVGDVGPAGGWVFHITDGGLHGLEAAPSDRGTAVWGCVGTNLPAAEGTAIGTGGQNTGDVQAACMEADIAARVAANYWPNGFNDWYLPSLDELKEMTLMIGLRSTTFPNLGGFIADRYYWSSTEFSDTIAYGLYNIDNDPTALPKDYVASPVLVRPIRSF